VKRERIRKASGRLENRLEIDGVVVAAACSVEPADAGNAFTCRGPQGEAFHNVVRAAIEEACLVGVCGMGMIEGTRWEVEFSLEAPEPMRALHLVKRCLDHLFHKILVVAEAHIEEPRFRLEVLTPHDFVGGILHELQGRGAKVLEIEGRLDVTRIVAVSLLCSVLGLSILIRSHSKGRAEVTLEPLDWVDASEA
jgi:translation elongation factor EF-G